MAGRQYTYAMVDTDLDNNPKIRRAGRDAREVYLFALRRNRVHGAHGVIPAIELEPWYLADRLMMPESDASRGVTACVTYGLLRIDGHSMVICGWDDDWARRPMTDAERQKKHRLKTDVRDVSRDVTDVTDVTHKSKEEKRREEERETEAAPPAISDPAIEISIAATAAINRLAKTTYQADSAVALKHGKALAKAKLNPAQVVMAVEHVGRPWLGTKLEDKIRPATLMQVDRVRAALDDIAAGNTGPPSANGAAQPPRFTPQFKD